MSLMDFVVSPTVCGRNVTDFWGCDAHETQIRCPNEVDGDTRIWRTRRGLNLSSIKLPRPWSPWESSPSRKIPMVEPGIEPRNLVISSQKLWPLDHEAGQFSKTRKKSHIEFGKTSFKAAVNNPKYKHARVCVCINIYGSLFCAQEASCSVALWSCRTSLWMVTRDQVQVLLLDASWRCISIPQLDVILWGTHNLRNTETLHCIFVTKVKWTQYKTNITVFYLQIMFLSSSFRWLGLVNIQSTR
jgi:hypothetical protein